MSDDNIPDIPKEPDSAAPDDTRLLISNIGRGMRNPIVTFLDETINRAAAAKKKKDVNRNDDGSWTEAFLERSTTMRVKAKKTMLECFTRDTLLNPITFPEGPSRQAYNNTVHTSGFTVKDAAASDEHRLPHGGWKDLSEALAYYGGSEKSTAAKYEVLGNWEALDNSKNLVWVTDFSAHRWGIVVIPDVYPLPEFHNKLIARGFLYSKVSNTENFYGKFDKHNRLTSFYYSVGDFYPSIQYALDEYEELLANGTMIVDRLHWSPPKSSTKTVTAIDKNGQFITADSDIGDDADMALQSFYPWFKDDIQSYMTEFLQAKSSVLLLIGAPGTGKSTFLRTALRLTSTRALIVNKPDVFMHPQFVSQCKTLMAKGVIDVVVMEDSDLYIRPRVKDSTDEATMTNNHRMAELLDATNGIDSSTVMKFIFTTNLKSISDVDSALLRPGRAFDYIGFRTLKRAEVDVIRAEMHLPPMRYSSKLSDTREFTLAEAVANTPPSLKNEGIISPRY